MPFEALSIPPYEPFSPVWLTKVGLSPSTFKAVLNRSKNKITDYLWKQLAMYGVSEPSKSSLPNAWV